jgi:peptidoglycan/xylan/chitin deacetylase (PgdA/CDA1 family)
MLAALRVGRLPRRSVVVTLDDGYSDSLHFAKPALEAQEVPATVFVTSGLLGREPWWDALARILSSAAARSQRLVVDVDGRSLRWNPAAGPGARGDGAEQIRNIQSDLLGWSVEARESAIAKLGDELGRPGADTPGPRGLEPAEVRQLAEGRWIEIGAHSVSHPMLATLPEDAQRYEIEQSKRSLEELIAAPVRAFSYPNGSHSDLTRALVRESGFECACASFEDAASRLSDPFCLPRRWVGDLDTDAFAAWLRRWR